MLLALLRLIQFQTGGFGPHGCPLLPPGDTRRSLRLDLNLFLAVQDLRGQTDHFTAQMPHGKVRGLGSGYPNFFRTPLCFVEYLN